MYVDFTRSKQIVFFSMFKMYLFCFDAIKYVIFVKKSTTPKKISTLVPTILVVLRYTVQSRSKTIFTYVDGTYEEEYSCWPPAICMIIISIAEIVLFCYDAAKGKTDATGPIAQIFIYNPHKRQEAWRFLTYMLVHVG